jgi:signal transduction histidine kinase
MRLVLKLTLAIAVGVTAVLLTHGYLRISRERELLVSDIRRDQLTLAGAVAEASRTVATQSGIQAALDLLDYVHKEDNRVFVVWARRGGAKSTTTTTKVTEQLVVVEAHEPFLVTRVPLVLAPRFEGQLEVRESLVPIDQYVRGIAWRVAMLIAWTAGVCALIIGGLGWALVGRSLRRLVGKVRRVGAGDLGGPLALKQRDEIGLLAQEIDRMCELLQDARARADRETHARIQTLGQLRHADRLSTVGKLASGVAHELGTPLNVIEARAKMIAKSSVRDERASANATIIVEQSERMTRTIRALLDFARQGNPHHEPADVGTLAVAAVGLVEPLARKNGVELSLAGQMPPVTLQAHAEQLRQVITNLLMNAIQAQPEGGAVRLSLARATLAPRTAAEQGPDRVHVRLRVEDDGPGIAPDALPHVFEPFFTTKPVGEGTGLGLSVAYGIVRDHRGWIEVESSMGKGTRFDVYLPLE